MPASVGVLLRLCNRNKVGSLVASPLLLFGVEIGLDRGVGFPGVRPFGGRDNVLGESSPSLADCSVHLAEVEADNFAVHPHFEFEVGPGCFESLG